VGANKIVKCVPDIKELWLLIKLLVPGTDGIFMNEPSQPEHTGQKNEMY
jgi:hypothetical protein